MTTPTSVSSLTTQLLRIVTPQLIQLRFISMLIVTLKIDEFSIARLVKWGGGEHSNHHYFRTESAFVDD